MSPGTTQWGLLEFGEQKELRLFWDRLRIRLIKRGCDLLLVEIRDNREIVELGEDPESDFRRYAFEKTIENILVEPRLPDRPVVVQPLHPLRLAPKAEVDFYLSIPVDIELSTKIRGFAQPIERVRSELLSDTWFGDQINGLLGYAVKSRARRESPSIEAACATRAICKIRIHNKSAEQLHCTRFCLRLDHCHLWQSGQALWTSPISIRYNGSEQLSSVDYSDQAPAELPNALKVADATQPPITGLIRRTFATLGTALA
jgi:hypothetical protein